MILYNHNNMIYLNDGTEKFWTSQRNLRLYDLGSDKIGIKIMRDQQSYYYQEVQSNTITDIYGEIYGTTVLAVALGMSQPLDTKWSDQTTDPIIVLFNQVVNSTTLTAPAVVDNRVISVANATGIATGSYIILFDPISVRFSTFFVVSVATLDITLDSPVDFAYPAGTFVDVAITEMAVNGAITPQIFGLRGTGAPPGVDLAFDLTRIIIVAECATAVDLSLFGDLAALTNGLLMRRRNATSVIQNVFNVKSNNGFASLAYDWTPYAATNPSQGVDGFACRLTFAGPDKLGVAIRLPIGEDAEFLIQDNLSGLDSLKIVAEGHIVEP